jgi:hypothetical protein
MGAEAPRDSTAFEVRDALAEPGCAVCRLAVRSVGRWLNGVGYEQVNDIALRNEIRIARGFCNAHAHQWMNEVKNVLGTAIVFQDVLRAGLRELQGGDLRSGFLRRAKKRTAGECPACRTQRQAEERYLSALLASVAADPALLEHSDGVCMRHARAAASRGGRGADAVVQRTRGQVEHLLSVLDEVIRKEDYRFRHEERTEEERVAPGVAIDRAAGADGLVETD